MNKITIFLLSILFFAPAIVTAQQTQDHSNHEHAEHKHDHMHHAKIETSALEQRPTVKLEVFKDSAAGWNLHLITENFIFAPEKINQVANGNEGHAHIYVNGKKIARLYGSWYHLSGLAQGSHLIRVSLNANDHSEFVFNGEPIEAIVEVIEE